MRLNFRDMFAGDESLPQGARRPIHPRRERSPMTKERHITAERLRQILYYDPQTGLFTWIVSKGKMMAGDICNCPNAQGYIQIMIDGVNYRANRLAWLYMTGSWPQRKIDHKNRTRTDNVFSNLREADDSQSSCNRSLGTNNTSGFVGVSFAPGNSKKKPWRAYVNVRGKRVWEKYFETVEEATTVRSSVVRKFHGEFASC